MDDGGKDEAEKTPRCAAQRLRFDVAQSVLMEEAAPETLTGEGGGEY